MMLILEFLFALVISAAIIVFGFTFVENTCKLDEIYKTVTDIERRIKTITEEEK